MKLAPALRSAFVALGLSGLVACDSTATIYISTPKFSQVQFLSAYPARKNGDKWERVCGTGQADGFLTNVEYLSTQRRTGASGVPSDQDISIRPQDVIETRVVDGGLPDDINLSSPGNVQLTFDCINQASTPGNNCTGANAPAATVDDIEYIANTSARGRGNNVLLLIDQSGSIGGLVRDGIFKEERTPDPLPTNFGNVASDKTALRIAATRRLMGILNSEDRFGALAFGEGIDLQVPCSEAIQDVDADLQTCFGARNLGIWSDGLNKLQSSTNGRSNLWKAVEKGYDFLRARHDTQRSNHIVVLTDGPDTCAGENRLTCTSPCTTGNYDELISKIQADQNDQNAPDIHIHFVQFESIGYPGRDARQVEVSCESGGHYQYINSNTFTTATTAAFQDALNTAVSNVRFAFMGHWQIATSVPSYSTAGAGVAPGALYALQGTLTVKGSSHLFATDRNFQFGYGLGMAATNATTWDRRPTLRKPCGSFNDCGSASGGGACDVVCSTETLTCANGATPVRLPDLAACNDGTPGSFCCGGECQTSGECAICN